MKTPTHALTGYIVARGFGFGHRQTILCVLGACLADLPLTLAYLYFVLSCFWQLGHFEPDYIRSLMDEIYFNQSWLLVAHNMFHSPISIAYLALFLLICCRDRVVVRMAMAFLMGSLSHSFLDIISHIGDGPLILWPLNDVMRVEGLFSHWFMGAPLIMEFLASAMLVVVWFKWRAHKA